MDWRPCRIACLHSLSSLFAPAERVGEGMFRLIMPLTILGAARVGLEEVDSRTMIVSTLGCNIAWAIVDGGMDALLGFFHRAGQLRRLDDAPSEEAAVSALGDAIGSRLHDALDAVERRARRACPRRHAHNLASARPRPPRGLPREFGAMFVIFRLTVPIAIPYFLTEDAAATGR